MKTRLLLILVCLALLAAPGPARASPASVPAEGWTRHALHGLSFAAPEHWRLLDDPEGDVWVVGFEPAQRGTVAIGIEAVAADRVGAFEREVDEFAADPSRFLEVDSGKAEPVFSTPAPLVAPNGTRLARKRAVIDHKDYFFLVEQLQRETRDARGGAHGITIFAVNIPEADVLPLVETLVASVMVDGSPTTVSETGTAAAPSGWTMYVNGRFGTSVRFPLSHFEPTGAPPANDDGRTFAGADGRAELIVWAGHNALGRTVPELVAEANGGRAPADMTLGLAGETWFSLKYSDAGSVTRWHAMLDGSDVVHNVLVRYPDEEEQRFGPVAEAVASSLGVPEAPAVAAQAGPFPQPASSGRLVPLGASGPYRTPRPGSAERRAIMDVARRPIARELRQPVIFEVSTLRTDGTWCYLQAVPRQPGGRPLDWSITPFAREWAADAMSDVVMVLMRRRNAGWQVVAFAIGPTDVHWYNWIDEYGLPELLFFEN